MFKHKKGYLIALTALVLATAIGGSIIVSSQNNQNRAEVTSPTGVKQKPDNLKIPGINKINPRAVFHRQFRTISHTDRFSNISSC